MTDTNTATVGQLRAEVRQQRREFAKSAEGGFARVMRKAMDEFMKMREGGVAFDDAVRGIEAELRDAWPMRTGRESRCAYCEETGYRERFCTHELRCARYRCANAETEWEHPYVVPCDCEFGDRLKGNSALPSEEQLAAIGRRKKAKPSGWSRMGR